MPEIFVRTRSLVLVVVLIAACARPAASEGPDTPLTADPGASQGPGRPDRDGTLTVSTETLDGPAIQIRDALARPGDRVRVAGALFVDAEGRMLLCSAIAESFPPQCGGERLEVVGLDLDSIQRLEEANGLRWAEGIELSGTVD